MCTLVLLRRPDAPYPLLLAANRDEMEGRPWLPPARHWDDRPDITGGQDQLAGGTWLAVNDRNMVAGVLNRPGSLGPAQNKRSRGELPLEALDHESAEAAAKALQHLDPNAYRPFNLLVADAAHAFWLATREGENRIHVASIKPGLSMLTAHDLNDAEGSPRIRHYRPLFEAAPAPDPDTNDWTRWQQLLASHETAPQIGPEGAMNVRTQGGFGTRSSSLIALPRPQFPPRLPIWRFCHGAPDSARWSEILLEQESP
ncbi:MAG TPA: NRDE family protein [Magnetovibrio sp.]